MSGNNEAIESALISDRHHKEYAKKTIDSGFLSSENLSENFTSENLTSEIDQPFENPKEEIMKIDSGICCVTEDFSKMKLVDPSINDLSASKVETSSRTSSCENDNTNKYYQQDEDGNTYLHQAIMQNLPKIALALIRRAPNSKCLDIQDDEGYTPLHLAVETNQWRVVRWLIVAGANPGPRNFRGESPLHLAARLKHINCIRAITELIQCQEIASLNLEYNVLNYKRVDLNQWDYEGRTAIHVAALYGHIDVLRALIFFGADINAREGKSGYTALHYAIESQNERLAYFLLTECKSLDTEVTTYAGRSVLQIGSNFNRDLTSILLSRGAASPNSSDDESQESDDEMIYESSTSVYLPQVLNGCA